MNTRRVRGIRSLGPDPEPTSEIGGPRGTCRRKGEVRRRDALSVKDDTGLGLHSRSILGLRNRQPDQSGEEGFVEDDISLGAYV